MYKKRIIDEHAKLPSKPRQYITKLSELMDDPDSHDDRDSSAEDDFSEIDEEMKDFIVDDKRPRRRRHPGRLESSDEDTDTDKDYVPPKEKENEKEKASRKAQILAAGFSTALQDHCYQLLRQYEDDPENNSTSLSALDIILKLPTTCCPLPITFADSHERVSHFLQSAHKSMEAHVYGHQKAKSAIIEYIVARLLGCGSRILGLQGPAGIGKTTLALKGVAEALGLPFEQVSIGGLRDVTYFSGSLRCWKGAHQGQFAKMLVHSKCLNPIIFIDEIDKVASETAQDIYGLLTHATDPLTNSAMQDHFLETDINLSKATFIFSYNDASVLPWALRNRIDEINLQGFNEEDKLVIAEQYILPNCLREFGLQPNDIILSPESLSHANTVLRDSTDSGVRSLVRGYQTLVSRIMVAMVKTAEGYSILQARRGFGTPSVPTPNSGVTITVGGNGNGNGNGKRPKPSLRATGNRLAPYARPTEKIRFPYRPTVKDIDTLLRGDL